MVSRPEHLALICPSTSSSKNPICLAALLACHLSCAIHCAGAQKTSLRDAENRAEREYEVVKSREYLKIVLVMVQALHLARKVFPEGFGRAASDYFARGMETEGQQWQTVEGRVRSLSISWMKRQMSRIESECDALESQWTKNLTQVHGAVHRHSSCDEVPSH